MELFVLILYYCVIAVCALFVAALVASVYLIVAILGGLWYLVERVRGKTPAAD
jgi:hypothetical protein